MGEGLPGVGEGLWPVRRVCEGLRGVGEVFRDFAEGLVGVGEGCGKYGKQCDAMGYISTHKKEKQIGPFVMWHVSRGKNRWLFCYGRKTKLQHECVFHISAL